MAEKLTKNNTRKHLKKHGFRARNSDHSGKAVLKRRRDKGRHVI